MAAKKPFKPQNLQVLLSVLLAVVIIGGGALFYFGLTMVRDYSIEVNHRLQDATASSDQIKQLQLLKGQISQSESLITKADQLFASPSNYQTQTLTDLKNYANQVGLTISSTNFDDPTTTGSYGVTITLAAPVSYKKLIQFLTLVEGNLPKMQVTAVNLKHTPSGNSDSVDAGPIKINISVR
jgi:hypothetical protein